MVIRTTARYTNLADGIFYLTGFLYQESKGGANMKKLIGMSILLVLGLTGCQNSAEMSASDPDQLLQNEVIHESLANTEYDSIEGFLADSDEGVFVLDSQAADRSTAPSNTAGFSCCGQAFL